MSRLAQLRVKYMDRVRGVIEVVSRGWLWKTAVDNIASVLINLKSFTTGQSSANSRKSKGINCHGISVQQVDLGRLHSKSPSFVKENKITPTKRKKKLCLYNNYSGMKYKQLSKFQVRKQFLYYVIPEGSIRKIYIACSLHISAL